MKKVLIGLLTLTMLLTVFILPSSMSASAASVITKTGTDANGFVWGDNGKSITILGYSGKNHVLVVPSTINGHPVTAIGKSAFVNNDYSFTGFTKITLPSSVTTIGDSAFYSCRSLTSVNIPNSVTSIGDYAFFGCSSLLSVNIPSTITKIGKYTFSDCGFTTLNLPNTITEIGEAAFSGCASIENLTIPNSVLSIGDGAFSFCSTIKNINIPRSVTSLGVGVLAGCEKLTGITVDPLNPNYSSSADGVLFNKDGSTLISFPCLSDLSSYVIPNSVTSIDTTAFAMNTKLTSVTIPNTVTSIGDAAFAACSKLATIVIPDSVTSVGDDAFTLTAWLNAQPKGAVVYVGKIAYTYIDNLINPWDDSTVTSITLNPDTKSIASDAFSYLTSLTTINIPDSVESIGKNAFNECSSLSSITLPNKLKKIGDYAFNGCSSLNSITIPSSVTDIGDAVFNECNKITSINVDSANTEFCSANGILFNIEKTKLIKCPISKVLTTFTVPSTVKTIASGAFEYSAMTGITLPVGLENIEKYAFSGCDSLESITLPSSLLNIGEGAFADCYSLANMTIPTGLLTIGGYAFRGCEGIDSISIPSSVTSIDNTAFYGCTSLKKINVNAGNQNYSSDSVGILYNKNKTQLLKYPEGKTDTSFVVPNSVGSIEYAAFYSYDLTKVTIPNSVYSIDDYAFSSDDFAFSSYDFEGTIISSNGSYAQYFAKQNEFTFKLISYKVTYNSNGGSKVDAKTVSDAAAISAPTNPTRANYSFKGWYTSASGGVKITFPYKVTGNVTLYAHWTPFTSVKLSAPQAVSASYNSITVKWTALPGVTGYEVLRSTSSSGTYKLIATVSTAHYTNGSLTTNKSYYYKIRAYQKNGTKKVYTSYTPVLSTKPIPSAPSGLALSKQSSTSLKATFKAVTGATGYQIYYGTTSSAANLLTTQTTLTCTKTGLKSGTTYYFKVRAYRTVGSTKVYGGYSSVVSIKL